MNRSHVIENVPHGKVYLYSSNVYNKSLL